MRRREQLSSIRQRIRSTRTGRLTLQATIALLGALVFAIGVVLIPFPGPGWLIVLAGLAIWAVEFVWAQRLLHFTRSATGEVVALAPSTEPARPAIGRTGRPGLRGLDRVAVAPVQPGRALVR